MRGNPSQPIHLAGAILGGHRHVCGLFDSPEDEYRTKLPFIREGLERKELAFHIVDPASRASYAGVRQGRSADPAGHWPRSAFVLVPRQAHDAAMSHYLFTTS